MSVWLNDAAGTGGYPAALATSEGSLLLVSIAVDPRRLESLLEALAQVSFPINPEIYHDAAIVSRYPDGHEEPQAVTLVEFPAYEVRVAEVRSVLAAYDFEPSSVETTSMLDEIHPHNGTEAASPGAVRCRVKHRGAAAG